MGFMKRLLEREQERGWRSLGEKYVCASCIHEENLAKLVTEAADGDRCDYCGRQSHEAPVSADVDVVIERIAESLFTEYGDPDEELPYDSGEGGYQGEVLSTEDVLVREDCDFENRELFEDIVSAFGERQWCKREYFMLSKDEALIAGWGSFTREILHRTRYLFLKAPDEDAELRGPGEISPADMLGHIGEAVSRAGLVRTCPAGSHFFRARAHDVGAVPSGASELASPPAKLASANRMSPAGIPMFYGAREERTAINEVRAVAANARHPLITVADFQTARDLMVVDLTDLPGVPSLFDSPNREKRPWVQFLRAFVERISQPIERDGREHVEYVPTQVVTEYFRRIFTLDAGTRIQGVLYPSAHASGGVCCVLFFDQDACCDQAAGWDADEHKWLGLVGAKTRVIHDGYLAFLACDELASLRQEGLRALDRAKLFSPDEWQTWTASGGSSQKEYDDFRQKCQAVAARYGLYEYVVERACLQEDYRPELEAFAIQTDHPRVSIVVDGERDPLFLSWLRYEAWRLGLRVVLRTGAAEAVLITIPFPAKPLEDLTDKHRPPIASALSVRMDGAAVLPPEAVAELALQHQFAVRELMLRLGYVDTPLTFSQASHGGDAALRKEEKTA